MPPLGWKNRDTLMGDMPPQSGRRSYDPVLEDRVAAMHAMLTRMRPGSDAEALRALRDAFPEASLSERVAVLSGGVGRTS